MLDARWETATIRNAADRLSEASVHPRHHRARSLGELGSDTRKVGGTPPGFVLRNRVVSADCGWNCGGLALAGACHRQCGRPWHDCRRDRQDPGVLLGSGNFECFIDGLHGRLEPSRGVESGSFATDRPSPQSGRALRRRRPDQRYVNAHDRVRSWFASRPRLLSSFNLSRSFHHDLQTSISAQLDEFRRLVGCDPTHIDGHHHVHMSWDVLCSSALPAKTPLRSTRWVDAKPPLRILRSSRPGGLGAGSSQLTFSLICGIFHRRSAAPTAWSPRASVPRRSRS